MSAATWCYAAFLGVAKPFAPLGYAGLMALYFATLALAVWAALVFVRPRLAWQMSLSGSTQFETRGMPDQTAYDDPGVRGIEAT